MLVQVSIFSLSRNDGLGEDGAGNGVGVGAEPDGLRGLVVDHVPDGSPSTFDVGDADDCFRCCVESHEAIGM